jgi:uncharacterized coiled-coil DUF342 family protein
LLYPFSYSFFPSIVASPRCNYFVILYAVQVDRPNKDAHEKELEALNNAINAIKEERQQIQDKIDAFMADPEAKSGVQAIRNKFNEMKAKKNALIEEKKFMRDDMDKVKNQADKIMKDKKDTRSNMKFNSIEDIDKEIAKLKRIQETTTMSLTDEKKLIKEMDALQASKKFVSELKQKDNSLEDAKEQRKNIAQQIAAKDKEIDALSKEMDEVMAQIKNYNSQEDKKREAIQGLFKSRDELKVKMSEKIKEKDAIRDAFRESNNAWYSYQRAIKAQKKMQFEEEKKKRDEERAAYLAKLEEEEMKKIPYEEEQALCDFLADYLERTYLKKDDDEEKAEKKDDVVEVQDDPFAKFKPVVKSEEDYFGKGKGKKKRTRQTKKPGTTAGPFTLSLDLIEQFAMISLVPPTSVEQVEEKVKDLREKKEWFKQQPRGSVPTAQDIRKANEKAVAKQRQADETGAVKSRSNAGGFSLSNDEFTPLGAGTTAAMNASWGQKAPLSG